MSNSVVDGIDYGPLVCLFGTWKGSEGKDLAPEPDGVENNDFYETITFEAVRDVANAEEQRLSIVRYHQHVVRKRDDKIIHDQVGYWLWDQKTHRVIQTLTIPRAVNLLAGGEAKEGGDGSISFDVTSEDGHPEWGIQQSAFMTKKARTKKFSHKLTVNGDKMEYREVTLVDIYGKSNFEHVDSNTLFREK